MSRDLERRRASTLRVIQLRTGHAPLNAHLHRIQRSDTPIYPKCAERNESVIHLQVLLHDQPEAHREARGRMRKTLPFYFSNLRGLLNNDMYLPALWSFLS